MWEEVAHLAHGEGVTVFLTTQYLEEADELANRVGIIDHGRIVAENTPAALKAEVGQASIEAVPADPKDLPRLREVLEQFGPCEEPRHGRTETVSVRLQDDRITLADIVRAIDAAGIELSHLQLHTPTLDDVFLAKTGRTLEGAQEEEEHAQDAAPAGAAS
jgi:ABC-2 type transport system ATP-binding protein